MCRAGFGGTTFRSGLKDTSEPLECIVVWSLRCARHVTQLDLSHHHVYDWTMTNVFYCSLTTNLEKKIIQTKDCTSFSHNHVQQLFQTKTINPIWAILICIARWRMRTSPKEEKPSPIVPWLTFVVLYKVHATIAAKIHSTMSGLKLLLLFWIIYQMLSCILEISFHKLILQH